MLEPARKICRLDIELEPMQWHTIQRFDNYQQALNLAQTINANGIHAMVSCICGSCSFEECEPCMLELKLLYSHYADNTRS